MRSVLQTVLLTLGALFVLSGVEAADKPDVKQVVAKMQAFYEKAADLKGKFKQVYTDSLYNRKRTSYGYLYVKKPGMMRWNYVKPERKSFIADGKVLWVWEPEDKQAFRNPLSTDTLSTGLTFLIGKGDLTKEFKVAYSSEKLGGPDDLVLKLTPKKPTGQYEHLLLAVKPDDHSVGESMVVSRHNTNHFIFTKLRVNTRLSRNRFRFRPPAGTRVIDGSKLKR
jgi:outer membrane lipoprotein carrier protein